MDKFSAVFHSLGPKENYGLEKDDVTFGMNQPTLEGNVHSPNPGPDRPKPELQEATMEIYGDDVPDYRADIMRQLQRQKENVGGVVVRKSPSKSSARASMADSIYMRIVSALKRFAADAERVDPAAATGALPSEPWTESEEDFEDPLEATRREVQEKRKKTEEEERRRREEAAAKEIGDPYKPVSEDVRVSGPAMESAEMPYVEPSPDTPLHEKLTAEVGKILDAKEKLVEALNRLITNAEVAYRYRTANRELWANAKKVVDEFSEKKSALSGEIKDKSQREIFDKMPHLRQFKLETSEAGILTIANSVRSNLSEISMETAAAALAHPQVFVGLVDGVKALPGGEERAEASQRVYRDNHEALLRAMTMMEKVLNDKADKLKKASAKVSGVSVLGSKRGEQVNARLEQVMQRAEMYRQDISDVAAKFKVDEDTLLQEQAKADYIVATVRKFLNLMRPTEKKESSLSASFSRSAAKSWEDATAQLGDIVGDMIGAIFGSDLIDAAAESDGILDTMEADMAELGGELGRLDKVSGALASAAREPAATAEPKAAPDESGTGWLGKAREYVEGLIPAVMPEALPVAAGLSDEQVAFIRDAVKMKKGEKKAKPPKELRDVGVKPGADPEDVAEEMAKTKVSEKEKESLELAREKFKAREEKLSEKQEKVRETPKSKKTEDALTAAEHLKKIVPADLLSMASVATEESLESNKQLKAAKVSVSRVQGEIIKATEEASGVQREDVVEPYAEQGKDGSYYLMHGTTRRRIAGPFATESEALSMGSAFVHKKYEAAVQSELGDIVNLLDGMLDANEAIVSVLRDSFGESSHKNFKELWVQSQDFALAIDTAQKEALLESPGVSSKLVNVSFVLADAKREYTGADAKKDFVLFRTWLKGMVSISSRVNIKASGLAPEALRERVREKLGPGVEEAEKGAPAAGEYIAEPITTEKPPSESAPGAEPEAALTGMTRRADDELDSLISEMRSLSAQQPDIMQAVARVREYAAWLSGFAAKVVPAIQELVAAVGSAAAGAEEPAEGRSYLDMGLESVKQFMESLDMPAAPALAGAAAASLDPIERKAGEYDKYDASKNRLEIVEGDDGRRKLVINKGLKNLVSKRVREMMSGEFKCGDSVQVDLIDHVGFGTVKAYIGQKVYRVEVDGVVMEVPAKNVLGLDNPWR